MRRAVSVVATAVMVLALGGCDHIHAPFVTRADAPVVLTGADLDVVGLRLDPDRVVAFRWQPSGEQ